MLVVRRRAPALSCSFGCELLKLRERTSFPPCVAKREGCPCQPVQSCQYMSYAVIEICDHIACDCHFISFVMKGKTIDLKSSCFSGSACMKSLLSPHFRLDWSREKKFFYRASSCKNRPGRRECCSLQSAGFGDPHLSCAGLCSVLNHVCMFWLQSSFYDGGALHSCHCRV